jgi:hypothetical protein
MEYTENGVPMFHGQISLAYKIWIRMKNVCLKEYGYDIWQSFVIGYNPTKKPKAATKKEFKKNNKIPMDLIMEGLCDSTKDKVGECSSTKELWDILHDIYFYPITHSKISKEGSSTKHEEICSSCQTDSDSEECEVIEPNKGELFFFNCEKHKHLEIKCPYLKIENDEMEDNTEIEKAYLISDLDQLKKEREENNSLKIELMKKNKSVQCFEEAQPVVILRTPPKFICIING